MLNFKHNGTSYENWSAEDALSAGVPTSIVGAAQKLGAYSEVAIMAESYRTRLATRSAGKLAEFRIKEEIARAPGDASPAELAMIDREAAARGIDRDALLAIISARAAAYREIALLIGALEAEAGAAIAAIPDDAPDIEAHTSALMDGAKHQAATAFAEALALINGGNNA